MLNAEGVIEPTVREAMSHPGVPQAESTVQKVLYTKNGNIMSTSHATYDANQIISKFQRRFPDIFAYHYEELIRELQRMPLEFSMEEALSIACVQVVNNIMKKKQEAIDDLAEWEVER